MESTRASASARLDTTELWFGSYTDGGGTNRQARYLVEMRDERILEVQLAPYGSMPTDIDVVEHDTSRGLLHVAWGPSGAPCTLNRYGPAYYAGNCIDGTSVRPVVLKHFDQADAERQGNWFVAGQPEIDVLDEALALLESEDRWDRRDDRICQEGEPQSVFCALYWGSIAVDGEYRHLRPAIRAVREAIEARYPATYAHILMDFNNAEEISFTDVRAVLFAARRDVMEAISD